MGFAADDFKIIRQRMNPDVFLVPAGGKPKQSFSGMVPVHHFSEERHLRGVVGDMLWKIADNAYTQPILENAAFMALVEWAGHKVVSAEEKYKPRISTKKTGAGLAPVEETRIVYRWYNLEYKGEESEPGSLFTTWYRKEIGFSLRSPEELTEREKEMDRNKKGEY